MTLAQPTNLARRTTNAGREIAQFLSTDQEVTLTLSRQDGERFEATIPTIALQVFGDVLNDIVQGKTVALIPPHAELTTNEAAQVLHVSRPYLIKMLESGLIPHRKVGTKRRIRYEDMRAYLEKEKTARREMLKALAQHDQEIGLYELEDM
jgi:excisionase family DNA binding protein